jgi:hypothetical protein
MRIAPVIGSTDSIVPFTSIDTSGGDPATISLFTLLVDHLDVPSLVVTLTVNVTISPTGKVPAGSSSVDVDPKDDNVPFEQTLSAAGGNIIVSQDH